VLEWVEARVVDLGLTSEDSPEATGRVVAKDDFLLIVPPKHPFTEKRRIRLAAVASEGFLMSGSGCEPAIRRLFASAGVSPKVAFTVRDTLALSRMVSQGLGVTLMPELAIPEDVPRHCRIPIAPSGHRSLLAVTHRTTPQLPAVEELLQLLT